MLRNSHAGNNIRNSFAMCMLIVSPWLHHAMAFQPVEGRTEDQNNPRLLVRQGERCLELGDPHQALFWFTRALAAESGLPDREVVHRTRLQLLLRQLPRLTSVWATADGLCPSVMSANGNCVLVPVSKQAMRVFDSNSGKAVGQPIAVESKIRQGLLSANGESILLLDEHGVVLLAKSSSGEVTELMPAQAGAVTIGSTEDGRFFYVARAVDSEVHILDAKSGRSVIRIPTRGNGEPSTIFFTFDRLAQQWATVNGDTILLGKGLRAAGCSTLVSKDDKWEGCQFSAGAGRFLMAWTSKGCQFWDIKRQSATASIDYSALGRTTPPICPPVLLDGLGLEIPRVVLVWKDKVVIVEPAPGQHARIVSENNLLGVREAARPSGSSACLLMTDHALCSLHIDGKLKTLLSHPGMQVNHWSFDHAGRRLVTTVEGVVRLWDFAAGYQEQMSNEMTKEGYVSDVSTEIRILDKETGFPHSQIPLRNEPKDSKWYWGPSGQALCVVDKNDGQCLIGTKSRGVVQVWNPETGTPLGPVLSWEGKLQTSLIDFHPTKPWLVRHGLDGVGRSSARVWDYTNDKPIGQPMVHESAIVSAQFVPGGKFITTRTKNGAVAVWDWEEGKRLGQLPFPSGLVTEAAADSVGKRLCTLDTSSFDGRYCFRTWDVATGRPLTLPVTIPAFIQTFIEESPAWYTKKIGLRFSDDGRFILWSGKFGMVVWDADTSELVGTYPGDWSRQHLENAERTIARFPLEPLRGKVESIVALVNSQTGLQVDHTGAPEVISAQGLQRDLKSARTTSKTLFDTSAETVAAWSRQLMTKEELSVTNLPHLDRLLSMGLPHPGEFHFLRGTALADATDWLGAREEFHRAALMNTSSWAAWLNYAECSIKCLDWRSAVRGYSQAAKLHPEIWEWRILDTTLEKRVSLMLPSMVAHVAGTLALPAQPALADPSWYRTPSEESRNWLRLAYQRGSHIKVYDLLIKSFPNVWQHYHDRALFQFHDYESTTDTQSETQAVIADLTRALTLNPDSYYSRMFRGKAYWRMKRWKEASEDFALAFKFYPDNLYHYENGVWESCVRAGAYDTALQVMESDKQFGDLYVVERSYWVARAHLGLGQYHQAIREFTLYQSELKRKALELLPLAESQVKAEPKNALAQMALALSYLTADHPDEARKTAMSAIEILPNDPVLAACHAAILARLKDWRGAKDAYERAMNLAPNDPRYRLGRANVLAELGQWDEAKANFTAADKLSPNDSTPLVSLALVALAQGDVKNYQRCCQGLVSRFSGAADLDQRDNAIWTCLLSPESGLDLAPLITVTRELVNKSPIAGLYTETLGLALYRQGDYAAAISAFRPTVENSVPIVRFYDALARGRLKQPDWKADAEAAIASNLKDAQANWKEKLLSTLWQRDLEAVSKSRSQP